MCDNNEYDRTLLKEMQLEGQDFKTVVVAGGPENGGIHYLLAVAYNGEMPQHLSEFMRVIGVKIDKFLNGRITYYEFVAQIADEELRIMDNEKWIRSERIRMEFELS